MGKVKYFNKTTQKWEYAETGGTPQRGTHYWIQQDKQPLYDYIGEKAVDLTGQCRLTVTLGTNQLDKSVLDGLVMNVTLPDGNTVNKYSGDATAFTTGSVTVVFPEVVGYKKPDNLIMEYKKGFVNKKINYLAEVVTVNPMVDGVVADSTYTYTVTAENAVALTEGASLGAVISGVTQWLVPHGVTMTVTPTSVDGYKSSVVEYIPSNVESCVNVEWNIPRISVYAVNTDGTMFENGEGFTGTPAGVAIINEDVGHSFMMGLETSDTASDTRLAWGPYDVWHLDTAEMYPYIGVDTIGYFEEEESKTHYNGFSDTSLISTWSDTYYHDSDYQWDISGVPAVNWARSRESYDGHMGYLGSAGEWYMVSLNEDAVNSCLSAMGYENMNFDSSDEDYKFWTSTQFGMLTAYIGGGGWCPKGSEYIVRPFFTMRPIIHFTIILANNELSFSAEEGMTWGEWIGSGYEDRTLFTDYFYLAPDADGVLRMVRWYNNGNDMGLANSSGGTVYADAIITNGARYSYMP